MTTPSPLEDAFEHHVWATIKLIDACQDLSPQQLQHVVPGTRGPILETLAHVVDGDSWDLAILEGRNLADVDEVGPDLTAMRGAMEENGARWTSFVGSQTFDPYAMVTEVDPDDGFRRVASVAMRLAAALEHGTDHRSQIRTALTTLGIQPPKVDILTFGVEVGRVQETPAIS
jgi:uncharacterized damage-inducible protein DinB